MSKVLNGAKNLNSREIKSDVYGKPQTWICTRWQEISNKTFEYYYTGIWSIERTLCKLEMNLSLNNYKQTKMKMKQKEKTQKWVAP